MAYDPHDTIAAIGTAPGGAARGMIRVSGPAALDIVARCFVAAVDTVDSARQAAPTIAAGELRIDLGDGSDRSLPCDLFLWPTDRSYTREPVAEFHTIGSPPLLQAALDAVCHAGARLAEPGEFTLRAFLAGRLDLTQAEAVLGVIDARESEQLQTALRQLAGGLATPLGHLREELVTLLAELEAGLDFAEEDIQFISAAELVVRLQTIASEIEAVAGQMSARLADEATYQVVLVGPPNAGKSRLFNALAERFGTAGRRVGSAIVSDERGTTRDYLVTEIDLGGIRSALVDTAGLEAAPLDEIAVAAQRLTDERRRQAAVRAFCIDAANACGCVVPSGELVIITKIDLVPHADRESLPKGLANDRPTVCTSSVTGEGLDLLRQALARLLTVDSPPTVTHCVGATAERCRESLRLAADAIARAIDLAEANAGEELVAAELRFSLSELGKVVGTVYTDDVLDRIFKSFCIGK